MVEIDFFRLTLLFKKPVGLSAKNTTTVFFISAVFALHGQNKNLTYRSSDVREFRLALECDVLRNKHNIKPLQSDFRGQ